jgi:serine/threonine protein phosphatase 1
MGRTYVIADVHGCLETFLQLLKQVNFSKEDSLYLLGDMIDRGPNSCGVISCVMKLIADGYNVFPLRGNHEQMLLDAYDTGNTETISTWLWNGGEPTLRSYLVDNLNDIPIQHIRFMEQLPYYYETETHVFVHAGLNFKLENPLTNRSKKSMLWKRLKPSEVINEKIGGKTLIVGHTIHEINDILESTESKYIRLDNGCFHGNKRPLQGNLIAYEISSGTVTIQRNIESNQI